MSYTRRPRAEVRTREKRLTNTSIAPSGARESTEVISNEINNVTSEWRGRVLWHSQEATQAQATSDSRRQQHTSSRAEERRRALLDVEIERIRRHYREQESVLEREITKLEQRYEWEIERLEEEEKEEEDCPVAEWWEVRSDYQPTECGATMVADTPHACQ